VAETGRLRLRQELRQEELRQEELRQEELRQEELRQEELRQEELRQEEGLSGRAGEVDAREDDETLDSPANVRFLPQ
jgi:hypothetical protein